MFDVDRIVCLCWLCTSSAPSARCFLPPLVPHRVRVFFARLFCALNEQLCTLCLLCSHGSLRSQSLLRSGVAHEVGFLDFWRFRSHVLIVCYYRPHCSRRLLRSQRARRVYRYAHVSYTSAVKALRELRVTHCSCQRPKSSDQVRGHTHT